MIYIVIALFLFLCFMILNESSLCILAAPASKLVMLE